MHSGGPPLARVDSREGMRGLPYPPPHLHDPLRDRGGGGRDRDLDFLRDRERDLDRRLNMGPPPYPLSGPGYRPGPGGPFRDGRPGPPGHMFDRCGPPGSGPYYPPPRLSMVVNSTRDLGRGGFMFGGGRYGRGGGDALPRNVGPGGEPSPERRPRVLQPRPAQSLASSMPAAKRQVGVKGAVLGKRGAAPLEPELKKVITGVSSLPFAAFILAAIFPPLTSHLLFLSHYISITFSISLFALATDPEVEKTLQLRLLLAEYHFRLALHGLGLTPKPGGWTTPPHSPPRAGLLDGEEAEKTVPPALPAAATTSSAAASTSSAKSTPALASASSKSAAKAVKSIQKAGK